jgi:threonine/homoserine/homoserine lactone efflux protein
MTAAAFVTLVVLHLLAAISPGPSFVVAVRTAAAEGFRVAAGLALGFGIGAVVWALAALLGLAVLFQVVPAVFTVLKFAGAAFLLWLAWQSLRHARDPLPDTLAAGIAVPRSSLSAVRLGLMTQLANPKPAVFFSAVFVGLLPPGTSLPWLALVLLVVLINETAWYVLVARLFSGGRARATYGRFKVWIDRTFGGVLAAMGLALATR